MGSPPPLVQLVDQFVQAEEGGRVLEKGIYVVQLESKDKSGFESNKVVSL